MRHSQLSGRIPANPVDPVRIKQPTVEFAIPPDRQMPGDLWRWDIDVDGVAILSTADCLTAVGLAPPQPGRGRVPSAGR